MFVPTRWLELVTSDFTVTGLVFHVRGSPTCFFLVAPSCISCGAYRVPFFFSFRCPVCIASLRFGFIAGLRPWAQDQRVLDTRSCRFNNNNDRRGSKKIKEKKKARQGKARRA
uniref:Uncharacterized protein n=1 Tax=Trypanosoma vivax (strain Y486) TaxID=1055687 RepID=G0TVE9_TRYVY|nr:hypothetical protein TVY486_0501240 [Trypanosoma vivax Y486]